MTQEPAMRRVWLHRAQRLNNSVNGNPRFDVTFVDEERLGEWTYRTSSDSSCNYEVTNYLNSKELVDVWLTKAERVYRIDKAQAISQTEEQKS